MKRITSIVAGLFIFGIVSFGVSNVFSPEPVYAQKDAACEALGGSCGVSDGNAVYEILKVVLNILSIVAGAAAVIMIIIAGFKFITSQGDPGAVTGARNTVLYAVIGIIVVVLSQIIVQFVLTETNQASQPSGPTTNTISPI
jgi:Phr family secreted Rap phosphatase inhibitor